MSDYKLVPTEPTAEMVSEGARYLRIMSLPEREAAFVFRAMLAAAPAVQGEPVAMVDADDDGMWADILPNVTVKVGQILYAAPQPAEQKPSTHWSHDNPGLADQYRAEALAARRSVGFGQDAYDVAPTDIAAAIESLTRTAPDVAGLVDALKRVMYCNEVGFLPESVQQAVSDALALYRKQGG